ncbi:unnamed protein product [Paramecium octaurelia]|uniref:Uncharacterized protein n=1 Tax=Paramecium octaurelia TaxID=43137 RepID=A0A8S1UV40_PAROT|nr:unnamed protein product [Paramecium octaurelia]
MQRSILREIMLTNGEYMQCTSYLKLSFDLRIRQMLLDCLLIQKGIKILSTEIQEVFLIVALPTL